MSRREVVISGRDAGLGTVMDKLRRSSKELGRGLIEEGLQSTKNSKDAIRHYEEQIRLIEKRNRVHSEGLRQQAQENLQTRGQGPKSVETYRSEVKGINTESKQDRIQTDLLRELIETVKITSIQEIRSDTSNSESKNNLIKRTSSEQGEEFGELQRRMMSDSEVMPTSSMSSSISQGIGGLSNMSNQSTFGGVATTGLRTLGGFNKPKGGKMGGLGKAGLVGLALAAGVELLNYPLTVRGQRETDLSEYASMTGGDVSSLVRGGLGKTSLTKFGPLDLNVSRSQYAGYLTQLTRAGGAKRGEELSWGAMLMNKGAGVDISTSISAARYGRFTGEDSRSMGAKIYGGMRGSSVFGQDGKDLTRMSGFLETLVRLQEGQLMGTGVLGSNANVNLMSRFAGLGGKYERAGYTESAINALNAGLKQTGTPETEAIKMSILRRINPEMSYFDLQTEMQKGVDAPGYAKGLMSHVKSTGGGLDSQKIYLQQLLGGQGQISNEKISSMFREKFSLDNLQGDTTDKGFRDMVTRRMTGSVSGAQEKVDIQKEALNNMSSDIGGYIDKAADKIGDKIKAAIFQVKIFGFSNPTGPF